MVYDVSETSITVYLALSRSDGDGHHLLMVSGASALIA